jgi:hypothetical protein
MIDIIKGHFNEMFDREDELSEERLAICRACPLFLQHKIKGMICNPNLWLDKETNTTSEVYREGMKQGCGCRLAAKTRVADAHCPLEKW